MTSNSVKVSDNLSLVSPLIREITTKAASFTTHSIPLIPPGDILTFKYEDQPRVALVVINDTGKTTYHSLRDNLLVTTFILEDVSEEIKGMIVKHLYKQRTKAERRPVIQALKAILGMDSYRSFMVRGMQDVYSLYLDIDLIDEKIDELTHPDSFTHFMEKVKKFKDKVLQNFYRLFKRRK